MYKTFLHFTPLLAEPILASMVIAIKHILVGKILALLQGTAINCLFFLIPSVATGKID